MSDTGSHAVDAARSRRRTSTTEYVSVRRAAAMLGVSEKTIRGLISRGELPSYRVGRLIRIRRRELIACVERSHDRAAVQAAERSASDIADSILGGRLGRRG